MAREPRYDAANRRRDATNTSAMAIDPIGVITSGMMSNVTKTAARPMT
jgi:hypothetical protein